MGAGEAPPQTPEGYKPTLPEGWAADRLAQDPLFAGFLKGAHEHKLNDAQLSWALNEFQSRLDMMNSPEAGEAELRQVWPSDQQLQQGLSQSYRGVRAFAEDEGHASRLDAKFGNDPDYIRLMARVGKEMSEDRPVNRGVTPADSNTLEDLKAHPAYSDPKHAEHRSVKARVEALYASLYPENT